MNIGATDEPDHGNALTVFNDYDVDRSGVKSITCSHCATVYSTAEAVPFPKDINATEFRQVYRRSNGAYVVHCGCGYATMIERSFRLFYDFPAVL